MFKLFGRKKYPNNKKSPAIRIYAGPEAPRKKKPDPYAGVYAGPEYFKNRNRREDEVLDVYAGPEFFGGPPDEPTEEDEPDRTVYGGPPLLKEDGTPNPEAEAFTAKLKEEKRRAREIKELLEKAAGLPDDPEVRELRERLRSLGQRSHLSPEAAEEELTLLRDRLDRIVDLHTPAVYAGPEAFGASRRRTESL